MSSSNKHQGLPGIPRFEPLPPDTFWNRMVNKILAPIFYLIFSIITAIIVVPVYTVIESYKKGKRRGVPKDRSYDHAQGQQHNRAADFLDRFQYSKPVDHKTKQL